MPAVVIGALRVVLGAETAQFTRAMSDVQRRMSKMGDEMKRIGSTLSRNLTLPITAFSALTLKTAGDFEQAMNKVGAVSGATGSQLEALRDTAKEMGRTTKFSASEAADALSFLAMAGFDADKAIAALPGTLQLAAAANMDLGRAADIVSNVLSGYGFAASDLGRVNDVLVKTFTSTNTSLEQLGEAMKYAGPVASAAGVGFEEASAAIGLMGNAGIQASMAGTSLRGAIARMLAPTKQVRDVMASLGLTFTDARGRLLPLDQIIQQLEPHADNAGAMMQLFGLRAGPAFQALVSQGSDALRELTTELENAGGTAQRISEAQMQGLNGELRKLKSAFEGLLIAIADSGLLAAMTDMVKRLTDIVSKLAEANPEILKFGTIVAGLAAVIGPVLIALGVLSVSIAAISAPVLALAAVVGVLATAVVVLGSKNDYLKETAYNAAEGSKALNEALGVFHQSAAPAAGAAAIALANDNVKLAKSALDAADAQYELARASLVSVSSFPDAERINPAFKGIAAEEAAALEKLTQAEAGLAQARRDQDRAARAVTGSMFQNADAANTNSAAIDRVADALDGAEIETVELGGASGGAAPKVDDLAESVATLGADLINTKTEMQRFNEQLDGMQDLNKGIVKGGKALQQSLSDSLFDPFSEGLRGMVHSFSQALRRMAADAISAQITQAIFGLVGGMAGGGAFAPFSNGITPSLGFYAEGTNYAPGGMAVVGEQGPELVNLPRGSQVIPNDALGGSSVNVINVMDPALLSDYVNTPAGEEVIMNFLARQGVV